MRQFIIGGAFALTMLLTACATAAQTTEPQTAESQAAESQAFPSIRPSWEADCAAKGGTLERASIFGGLACVIPFKDAGKDCTDDANCEGECWSDSRDEEPGPDGKVHGQCQPDNMPFGCYAVIKAGKAGPLNCNVHPSWETDCAAKGGKLARVGMLGVLDCVIPFKDAGKDCTDDADCEGACWSDSRGEEPGPDGKVHGQCQPDNMPFGCYAVIEAGKAGPLICTD